MFAKEKNIQTKHYSVHHRLQVDQACGQCATFQWTGKQLSGPQKELAFIVSLVLVFMGVDLRPLHSSAIPPEADLIFS